MSTKFYLTTTLPYVNAEPHIGFALETVQADVIARYQSLLGKEVFFNTGTDEHGLKIYQKSIEKKQDPQKYCDEYATKFNDLKQKLNLSYNSFIRTTDENHKKAAQHFWNLCLENGDIYKNNYQIKYCVGCELEKTESELVDGKCPLHPNRELELIDEENYFFRFSKYQKQLLELYKKNPDFVIPAWRQKEITNFVSAGLQDFSISRLKSKMPWGIEVPNDPDHVMYVWFDALINYISSLGWPDDIKKFNDFWPGIQFAGKDNLRQQSAMWQAMLISAGLPNSKQIIIHGFMTSSGQKMSKSLGNVINPFDLVNEFDTDALRYYLLKEVSPFEDSDFTRHRFIEVYNSDLANGLGNLVQRVSKMAQKHNLQIDKTEKFQFDQEIASFLNQYEFPRALELIWQKIQQADKQIEQSKPWSLEKPEAEKVLTNLINQINNIAYHLEPFLPTTSQKIKHVFAGKITAPEKPLFPRI